MLALGAQTGPVFLTYRASAEIDRIAATATGGRADHRLHRARRRAPHAVARRRRRSRRAGRRGRPRSRRSTSPTATIARRARRGRAPRCATRAHRRHVARRRRRCVDACWRWRSRTTRCRSCRTTATVKDLGGLSPDDVPRRGARAASSVEPGPGVAGARAATSRCTSRARGTRCGRASPRMPNDPIGSLDVSVLQEQPARAGAEDRRRAHRQADRFRRRRARHQRRSSSWSTPARPRSRFRCSRSASPI